MFYQRQNGAYGGNGFAIDDKDVPKGIELYSTSSSLERSAKRFLWKTQELMLISIQEIKTVYTAESVIQTYFNGISINVQKKVFLGILSMTISLNHLMKKYKIMIRKIFPYLMVIAFFALIIWLSIEANSF